MNRNLLRVAVCAALMLAGASANADPTITAIHDIQGSGATNLLDAQVVTIEAIVVGDFQNGDADERRNLGGFYVQEEDADADTDPATSEGLFVFEDGNTATDVSLGDLVQVTGTIGEFSGETRIGTITDITVISSGNPLPTAASITLTPNGPTTLDGRGEPQPDLEAFEGMRVRLPERLSITEGFQLERFNEIKLNQGERLQQFTQNNAPDPAGFAAHLQNIGSRTIVYDDGLSVQNTPIGNLDGFGPVFNTARDLRFGDTIENLSGVLTYQWAGNNASPPIWRVRAAEDGENTFEKANARPTQPEAVGGTLNVAVLNVLNYFATRRDQGPTAIGQTPRGADDATEFERQTAKLVTALDRIDADIVGLVELENDFLGGSPGNAVELLVNRLNAVAGAGTYAWVDPGRQFVGGDAIANGIIYKPAAVQVITTDVLIFEEAAADATSAVADVLNPFVPPSERVFNFQRTRPAVAATFEDGQGERFTVAVNHFKAKGDSNLGDLALAAQAFLDGGGTGITQADIDALLADPNFDQFDGQAFWSALRAETSVELAQWLTDTSANGYAGGSNTDPDIMILGDLNSYGREDPIVALEDRGFIDLGKAFDADPVTFLFDAQSGALDYALASPSLSRQVTGATVWDINADEFPVLDYNTNFGRDVTIFDGSVPFRASDHDPVIVGVTLGTLPDEVFADDFEDD